MNMKYIPSNRHPKCWHCKYSLSLINPLRGVAHPSDRTWVHSVSSYKHRHRYRLLKQRVYQTNLLNWSRVLIHKERISSSIKTKILFMMNSLPPQFCSQHQLQHIIYIFFWGGGDTIKKIKEGYVNVLNIGELDWHQYWGDSCCPDDCGTMVSLWIFIGVS